MKDGVDGGPVYIHVQLHELWTSIFYSAYDAPQPTPQITRSDQRTLAPTIAAEDNGDDMVTDSEFETDLAD